MTTPTAGMVLDALERHTNVLLYGPPGTGKTFLMREVIKLFQAKYGGSAEGDAISVDTEQESEPLTIEATTTARVDWVTFHQSYSYEDFVIALRPDPQSEKLISLVPRPGILLEAAAFARQPDSAALIAIDEINRGNVSRIFGEFITLLEPDKRLAEDGGVGEWTVHVTLPYLAPAETLTLDVGEEKVPVARNFTLPRNLFTLASMNSVDKSVAPLDTALRRRFHVVEFRAEQDRVADLWDLPQPSGQLLLPEALESVAHVRRLALHLVATLNEGIRAFLGGEYCLGQWYLSPLIGEDQPTDALSRLSEIWDSTLYPQLEELFQGRVEQLAAVLQLADAPANSPVELMEAPDEFTEIGGLPHIQRRDGSMNELIRFLRHVAGVGTQTTQDQ